MSSISSIGNSVGSTMLKQMQEEMFKKVDTNGDGSISKEEFSQLSNSGESQGGLDAESMFTSLDADNDGAINRLESDASIARLAQQMESRGAGPQGQPPGPPPSGGSGLSGKTEESANASTIFDEMDTNQDGTVSLAELTAALESQDKNSSSSNPESLLENIGTALQSGDISSAKELLAALQQDVTAHNGGDDNEPFSKDLQALAETLESGDLVNAQTVLSGIQEKMLVHGPQRQMADNGQNQDDNSRDSVRQTLQGLLDSVDGLSGSNADSSVTDTLKSLIAAALNSYKEQGANMYLQGVTGSTALSALA